MSKESIILGKVTLPRRMEGVCQDPFLLTRKFHVEWLGSWGAVRLGVKFWLAD